MLRNLSEEYSEYFRDREGKILLHIGTLPFQWLVMEGTSGIALCSGMTYHKESKRR